MDTIAPTADSINLDAPDEPLAAWSAAVRASRWTLATGDPDPFARPCQPWCAEAGPDRQGGPAHAATTVPEDRACTSREASVLLAHHRGDDVVRPGVGMIPARAEVGIVQRHHECEPVIVLDRRSYRWAPGGVVPEHVEALRLTPAEARALAALLITAAAAASTGTVR